MLGKAAVVLFVISCPITAAGFLFQMFGGCATDGGLEDMQFYNMLIFNKQLLAEYDNSSGVFVPCTQCVNDVYQAIVNVTTALNTDRNTSLWVEAKMRACKLNAQRFWKDTVQRTTPGLTLLQKVKISISVVVFGLGLIFLLAGLISWNKSHSDGYVPIPGDTYPEVS